MMEVAHAKNYYVFPIYPMLLAGGAVAIERWLANRASWTRTALVAVILLASLPAIPLATWMLTAGASPRLSKRYRLQTLQGRGAPRVTVAATDCRPVRMARDG